MFLGLTSCSNDNQDLVKKIEDVKARSGRPIEAIPSVKPMKTFLYPSQLTRRDPFFQYRKVSKAILNKKKVDFNAPNLKRNKQILEQFNIKDLRMVGVLRNGGTVWGLVSAPDDMVYKVMVGGYIGKNYGKVVGITDNKIRVVERYKDNKKWKKRKVKLSLDVDVKNTVDHKKIKFEEIIH
jgi:type IV pilus assembly protein PilP